MRLSRLLKHVLISVVAGFILPLLYTIASGLFSTYVSDPRIKHLLWLPIGWPRYLYFYLIFSFSRPGRNDVGLLVFQIACNVIPYAVLTFVALSFRSIRKAVMEARTPPSPPWFE